MNAINFAKYIRLKTKTNATTFSDADILSYANIIKDDIAKEITRANEDYFGIELLRNLVAGQRSYGIPSYVLNQIKYVQAKLDGTEWKRLAEFDVNTYKRTTDESSILEDWSGSEPMYDIFGSEITIYSDTAIIDVADGLKLWAIIYPEDLTSLAGSADLSIGPSATTFGMPRQLHKIWANMVVIEYKNSKEKPMALNQYEQNIQVELEKAINSLKEQNLDRSTVASVPYDDGQDY